MEALYPQSGSQSRRQRQVGRPRRALLDTSLYIFSVLSVTLELYIWQPGVRSLRAYPPDICGSSWDDRSQFQR